MARNTLAALHSRATWFFSISVLLLLSCTLESCLAACPECDIADNLLKPCNTKLDMLNWPGTLVYQPTEAQAPCGCNQNYYDLMVGCLRCQSSDSAKYSVKDVAGYQLICQLYGQEWKDINLPTITRTTTVPPTSTTTTISSSNAINTPTGDPTYGGSHSNLSSGAIAGIVVSVVALIVALSVAGYVWNRRRKEIIRDSGDIEDFKYRDEVAALPQYTGMIQPTLPPISKVSNLRVTNPDSEDEEGGSNSTSASASAHAPHVHAPHAPPVAPFAQASRKTPSFEVRRTSSPGWRRGSFDDD